MDNIYAKIHQKGKEKEKEKFKRILCEKTNVFPQIETYKMNPIDYNPKTLLEDDNCYRITEFSTKKYCGTLVKDDWGDADFFQLSKEDILKIDYIFVRRDDDILFQNVSKLKLISKKGIFHFGEDFRYQEEQPCITINTFPDAIYVKKENTLYFKKFESITSIFKGISELYREATDEEVNSFLQNDFISLINDYSCEKVKTSNRKKIALAEKVLNDLNNEEKNKIYTYIGDFCPDLKNEDNSFKIGSENDLKLLLYGIEQRFYVTTVGGEKRIANSVITLSNGASK